ncbi:MAG: hypothetical protein JWN76_3570 [Chitinophagaceae bacterium]|nr:hypothetical protein [Chitinophagaceae bacterium]
MNNIEAESAEQKMTLLKKRVNTANILSFILSASISIHPFFRNISGTLLILNCLFFSWYVRFYVHLVEVKTKAFKFPKILFSFFFPALGLFLVSVNSFFVLRESLFYSYVLIILSSFSLFNWQIVRDSAPARKLQHVLFILLTGIFFSIGTIIWVNCKFDDSTETTISAQIVSRESHSSRGSSPVYSLTIKSSFPFFKQTSVNINKALWNGLIHQSRATLHIRKGFLYVQWFQITPG